MLAHPQLPIHSDPAPPLEMMPMPPSKTTLCFKSLDLQGFHVDHTM
uniref:Uncharacterized protein n=1 Tax=Anguilla anguilla TaxID=7936 RepID=A0A0E9RK12_ANGAN